MHEPGLWCQRGSRTHDQMTNGDRTLSTIFQPCLQSKSRSSVEIKAIALQLPVTVFWQSRRAFAFAYVLLLPPHNSSQDSQSFIIDCKLVYTLQEPKYMDIQCTQARLTYLKGKLQTCYTFVSANNAAFQHKQAGRFTQLWQQKKREAFCTHHAKHRDNGQMEKRYGHASVI